MRMQVETRIPLGADHTPAGLLSSCRQQVGTVAPLGCLSQKIETPRDSAANLIRTTERCREAPSQSCFHRGVSFVPVQGCEIIQHSQANPRAASSPANVGRAPALV